MKRDTAAIDATKRLMGALLGMKPKPHEDMKIGKPRTKSMTPKRSEAQRKKTKAAKRGT